MALVVLEPGLARGQAPGPEEEPPWQMTPEQLEDAGWEHQEAGAQPGSVIGGLLAVTIGTVVHGAGHLYAGDVRTGRTLLIAEGVGLGMLGTGILLDTLTNSEGNLAALYRSTTALGSSLFVTTWLLDVIGTFKGTGTSLYPPSGSLTQIRIAAAYTHLFGAGLPLQNATEFEIDADLGVFFIHPRGGVGIDHRYARFGLETGVRFGLGRRELSYLDLKVEADEVIFSEDGYAYELLAGSLGLSIDLGDTFAHLDGIVYSNRLGFGAQLFRFDYQDSRPLNADSVQSLLLVEASLATNPIRDLGVEVGYLQRPDLLVGQLSHSVGAFFATLTYALTDGLEVFADVRLGAGVQVFSGTAFYFRPWHRSSE